MTGEVGSRRITEEDLQPGQQIGSGREKTVIYRGAPPPGFKGSIHGDVIKRLDWEKYSEGEDRAEFARKRTLARHYEAKIAHLLFPENFPDVHGANWAVLGGSGQLVAPKSPSEIDSDFVPGTHKKKTNNFGLFKKMNDAGIYIDQDAAANAGNVIETDDGVEFFTDISSIYVPNVLRYIRNRLLELRDDDSIEAKDEVGRLMRAKKLAMHYDADHLDCYSLINTPED